MINPTEAIAELDRALAETGEDVILRRYTASTGSPRPKIDLPMKAFVRPLQAEELVGNMDSSFSKVITSPTGKTGMLPMLKGDKIVIDGRERNVELPKPIKFAGQLVRITLMIGG